MRFLPALFRPTDATRTNGKWTFELPSHGQALTLAWALVENDHDKRTGKMRYRVHKVGYQWCVSEL
jgi:hypothetical protein